MSRCGTCPRCGSWGLETLRSHSYCWECNFFPEDFNTWQRIEFRHPNKAKNYERSFPQDPFHLCRGVS